MHIGRSAALCGALALAAFTATPAAAASDYLRCDGQSKGMGVAEGLARLTVVIGTMGLLGAPESDNVAERRFGKEGVQACTEALADGKGKHDDRRRARLVLARAIHHIEAKDYDAALKDVRSFPQIGGEKATDPGFLRSLGLSALDLEAAILVRMGKPAEAEAAALRMAAQSPYDLQNLIRASRYMAPQTGMTDAKRAYFRKFIQLSPEGRLEQIEALESAGDFGAAADSSEGLIALVDGIGPVPLLHARAAVQNILAGRADRAEPLIATARRQNDEAAAKIAGSSGGSQESVSRTDELLDFARIAKLAADGKIAEARSQFGARSRWLAPSVPAVAHLTAKLRAGADPAGLAGALQRDPETLKADAVAAQDKALTDDKATKALYGAIRPFLDDSDYSGLAKNIRQIDKSKFLQKKTDDRPGETLTMAGANGVPAGEGFLLHAALLAKSRGKEGFAIMPLRFSTMSGRVLIDDPSPKLPADAFIKADEVIKELGPRFPKPEVK